MNAEVAAHVKQIIREYGLESEVRNAHVFLKYKGRIVSKIRASKKSRTTGQKMGRFLRLQIEREIRKVDSQ